MNGITIYSASAGSGKTFSLVVNYINLLLSDPQGYRKTLAVTFTNASTKEMKDRIIDVLHYIASGKKQGKYESYLQRLMEINPTYTEGFIRQRAGVALENILHNYSFFNILTIDSFFQKVLRNMAKELGIDTNFNTILDEGQYNQQAVKNIISQSQLTENQGKRVKTWLMKLFQYRNTDKKKWNFEKDLLNITQELRNSVVIHNIDNKDLDLDNLEGILLEINEKRQQIKQVEKQLKSRFAEILEECNLTKENFYFPNRGIYLAMQRSSEKFFPKEGLTTAMKYLDEGKTLKKIATPKVLEEFIVEANDQILNAVRLKKNIDLFEDCIYFVGVLRYLFSQRNQLLKQDNAFLLSNTKHTLARMEFDSDGISFIYEKIGSIIEHIMIDEFQDTSLQDWNNLNALILECLSKGGNAFIYGDIKQSIYRWNDGDWRIMDSQCRDAKNQVIPLKDNFRTDGKIVEFNNEFFREIFDDVADVEQVIRRNPDRGAVRLRLIPKYDSHVDENADADKDMGEEENEVDKDMISILVDEINTYKRLGYSNKDIAILCNTNKQITQIAQELKALDLHQEDESQRFRPISDVAFLLSSSLAVQKVVAAMRYLFSSKNLIAKELISEYAEKIDQLRHKEFNNLVSLCIEIINTLDLQEDTTYLSAFIDQVHNFICKRSTLLKDFIDYWETELCKKSIEMKASTDSLRLTTIHKSKGLEYPIVIIPYCDWNLNKRQSKIWVENTEGRFLNQPLLYASMNKLKDSDFDEEYQQEIALEKKDNVNKLYVAMTRPKNYLSMLCHLKMDKNGEPQEGSVSKLLFDFAQPIFDEKKNEYFYQYGNLLANTRDEQNQNLDQENQITRLRFSDNSLKFNESTEAKKYFFSENETQTEDKRLIGSKLHEIMSKIKSRQHLEKVVNSADFEQNKLLINLSQKILDFVEPYHWFDGSYQVVNERNIFHLEPDGKGKILRPDRIMLKGDTAIVVDYKFAKPNTLLEERQRQVRQYISLLQELGFKDVRGYLWYIELDNQMQSINNQSIIEI